MPSARKSRRRAKARLNHSGLFGYPGSHPARNRRGAKKRQPRVSDQEAWNEQLHLLAEALPQIVWTADPDGYQDYFNSAWFEYTGLSERQTYAGKTALHPEDFPVYVRRWSRALKDGKAYEAKYRFRRAADGLYRWHLVRGLPIRNGKGKVVKWVGTFTDIHEMKEAEEALRESERRIARTQRIAHLGSWELDLRSGTLRWSDEVYRIFNLRPQQFKATYEVFLDRVHPEDRVAVDKAYTESLRKKKDAYEIEHRILRKGTGEVRWVYEKCHHFRGEDGKVSRSIGMVMDITERKKAAEKVQRLNEKLEERVRERTREIESLRNRDRTTLRRLNDMINNVHVGMLATDEDGTILHMNSHYSDMFHVRDRHKIVGMHIRDLLRMVKDLYEQPEEVERTVEMALRRMPVRRSELQLKDGRTIVRDYIPIFDDGVFRGNVGVFRDSTRERRIDAAKSDFMSFASHQLRTPLTAIRWALGRLRRALPPGLPRERELLGLVDAAHQGARNMAETINTMLSIARIEAGTVSLSVTDVRLCVLLRHVKDALKEECDQRKQRMFIRCPSALRLRTDAKLLSEVAVNLLSNAVKYSPENTRIVIEARASRAGVRLDIHDRGYGIPRHEQDKIFGKFYRGENAVRALAEGTGLGLYLVSLLMRTLRGKVQFVSKEGKGSTFTVLLPCAIPPDNPSSGASFPP